MTSMKSVTNPLGSVPDNPPLGLETAIVLSAPAGSEGVVKVNVCGSVTFTFVAATPPTGGVAPAWNERPVTVRTVPVEAPDTGELETTNRAESSDVLPSGSVAVAVTSEPFATATGRSTLKATLPDPSVVTGCVP